MLVGFEANAGRRARLEPIGHEGRGDTSTRATMGFIANGRDQQVRFFADLLARGGNGIGPRRERAGERCELLGRERRGKGFDKVDQLTSLDPGAGLSLVEEPANLRMPGLSGKGFEGLGGEGRDVPLSDQRGAQGVVRRQSRRRKNGIDEGRVVLREKFERVAGLIGRSGTIEAERQDGRSPCRSARSSG